MGQPVEIHVCKDYDEAVAKLQNQQAEFAFLSPLVFLEAEEKANVKVLLKKVYGQSEFYYSALVVKKESPLKSVADLKGKKIAFVDKKSASGFMYPMVAIHKAGLSLSDFAHQFLGNHDDAFASMLNGEADVAAVWADEPESGKGVWSVDKFADQNPQVRVLSYSEPIPNDAFVVSRSFYESNPDRVLKMMDTLIAVSDDQSQVLKNVLGVDSLATATSRHYDVVRALKKISSSNARLFSEN